MANTWPAPGFVRLKGIVFTDFSINVETLPSLFRILYKGGFGMNAMGDLFFLLPIVSILFYLILVGFGIFIVLAFLKQGKERNALLKEIAEELRRR